MSVASSTASVVPEGTTATIPTVTVKSSKGDESVGVYLILVGLPGREDLRIERRFSDFLALHSKLPPTVQSAVQLPGKKWFGNMKPSFLQERRQQLEKYLQTLLGLLQGNEALQSNRIFCAFLGVVSDTSFQADHDHLRGYGAFSITFGEELGSTVTRGNVLGVTLTGKVDSDVISSLVTELLAMTFDYARVHLLLDLTAVDSGEAGVIKMLFAQCKKIKRIALVSPSTIKKVFLAVDSPFAKLFVGIDEKIFDPAQKGEAWKWLMEGMETIQSTKADPILYKYTGSERFGREMKVLIIGGGPAGLTLAAQLVARGFQPKILERLAPDNPNRGFVLGLMPTTLKLLGSLTTKDGQNLRRKLVKETGLWGKYNLANDKGKLLGTYSFGKLIDKHGDGAMAVRGNLLDIIATAIPDEYIHYKTCIKDLQQDNNEVTVTYEDDTTETFDVVCACDGIHSRTRRMVFGTLETRYLGASGWSWPFQTDTTQLKDGDAYEFWSHKRFTGIYPTGTPGKSFAYAARVVPANAPDPVDQRIPTLLKAFDGMGGDLLKPVFEALKQTDPEDIFHDDLNDFYTTSWSRGRVVLCGDAAHAILPTGGVGASMAMESATVLAEELARSDSKTIALAFRNYESRRRGRVDRIQSQSRALGKWAVGDVPAPLASLRDFAATFFSEEEVMGFYEANLDEPI
eukprot:TRINITY_DN63356_c0_g1_i1.p1 TRINITY_DN63356_c0_g1~~TRINITY_DN63356_c0_g1_i1.p1  ORF type:complete len:686 (-),score=88.10 TRINITY_DN63356_c0_g1_i1:1701-3758(-)